MVHDTTHKKIKVTSDFFTFASTEVTCYICYFCYRPAIFLLFYLFTFLPLKAFLPLLANNLGQLLHFS